MLKLILLLGLAAIVILWWRGQSRRKLMPVDEARALLGVSEADDAEAVRAAHRRLIAKVHPDSGGTSELARRTNMARDVVLAELSSKRSD